MDKQIGSIGDINSSSSISVGEGIVDVNDELDSDTSPQLPIIVPTSNSTSSSSADLNIDANNDLVRNPLKKQKTQKD